MPKEAEISASRSCRLRAAAAPASAEPERAKLSASTQTAAARDACPPPPTTELSFPLRQRRTRRFHSDLSASNRPPASAKRVLRVNQRLAQRVGTMPPSRYTWPARRSGSNPEL